MMTVCVAFASPKKQVEIPLTVEENCTIALAIQRSGILAQFPEIQLARIVVGLNGKLATLYTSLQENDRIEIYRPLKMDPKQARHLRVRNTRSNI